MSEIHPKTSSATGISKAYLEIDALVPEDVTSALDLFSRAIPHSQLRRSIYLARGADRYLSCLMQHGDFHRHEQLWGIKDESGRLLAAGHSRDLPGASHFNNCAVEPAWQGHGLGTRMFAYWETEARKRGARKLTLDVADENTGGRRLYARCGFEEAGSTHEFRLDPAAAPDRLDESPLLQDWPLALAQFEAFGFGRFRLEWLSGASVVDLTEDAFRIRSAEGRLLAALHRMDAGRAILLRTAEPSQEACWKPTGAIIRMKKDLP